MVPPPSAAVPVTDRYVIVLAENLGSVERLLRSDGATVLVPETAAPPETIAVGRLEIRLGERRVLCGGLPLALSQQEVGLLAHLAWPAGRARCFPEIAQAVWGSPQAVEPTVVHSAVLRLRRKLVAADAQVGIESIRGYGLRLTVQVPYSPEQVTNP